jgi:hypothetical protein
MHLPLLHTLSRNRFSILINFFIPEFINCYDIKPVEGKGDDKNYFYFMLTLYFASYNDDNNNYDDACL